MCALLSERRFGSEKTVGYYRQSQCLLNTVMLTAVTLLLLVQKAMGDEPYVLKSLNIRSVEQVKNELLASKRLLLGNETSLDLDYDEAFIDRDLKDQLKNMTIKVLARKIFPFICFEELPDGQQKLSGFVGEIWNTLEEHLGFKTQLITDLKTAREWHISLNPRELSLNRLSRYSYTFPISKIWYHLFAKGKPSSGHSIAYIYIFDNNLWAVICIVMLVLSVSLWGMWRVRVSQMKYANQSEQTPDLNYSTCILSVLGCMINQGSQFKTERWSSIRIITLLCILMGLIITTSFSAILISKLATVKVSTREDLDLKSLAQTPRGRTLCVATSSYAYKSMNTDSKLDYLQQSSLNINGFPCTPGDHDIVPAEDYCTDNAVVLETLYNAIHATKNGNNCEFYIYNKKHFPSHLILVVRKGFPFLRIINKYLLRMHESGLIGKLTEVWQPKQSHRRRLDQDAKSRAKLEVSFYHIKPLIVAYLWAVVIAWMVLALEKLYKWW